MFFSKITDNLLYIARLAVAVAWALFIAALTLKSMPVLESDAKGFTVGDKILHLALFGVLTGLILWCGQTLKKRRLITVSLIVLVYAFLIEYLQQFIPGRQASPFDLIFAALGIVLALWLATIKKTKSTKPSLLLHLCCGPCGAQISSDLRAEYQVTLYFANPNLDSRAEYDKRLKAAEQVARAYGLTLISEPYDHGAWLKHITGLEDEPERGKRCLLCYEYRLKQAAAKARELGLAYFGTSLSVSPHKDGQAVIHIGRALAGDGVKFLDRLFGERGGFAQSVATAKKLKLYRQKYCGCEFSKTRLKKF